MPATRSQSIERAFGAAVRRRRTELKLSQEALAAKGSLHRTYVSQIERGVKSPSLDSMSRLATALELGLDDLMGRALRIFRGENEVR